MLIVEDSPTDAKLVMRELRRGGRAVESRRVETALDMREALNTETWDLVISDWSMPHFSALEALALLKRTGKDLPFIIVSGTVGEDSAVEGMRSGAHDYLLKDRLTRLLPAIERELRERDTRAARARAEEALRISEVRLARLAESGIVGICVADLLGSVREANEAYLAMLGYTREELADGEVFWSRLTPPEHGEGDEIAIVALRNTGVARPWRKELFRKDGSRIPVLIGAAMLDASTCLAIQIDLSEQKRAEDALLRTQQQLLQAQKMEAIGSLAGGVAHDFNNLLSVILSYASMLASDLSPGDPMEEGLQEIKHAGERAAALTRQLLAFSRRQMLMPQDRESERDRRADGEDASPPDRRGHRVDQGHGPDAAGRFTSIPDRSSRS